MTGIKVAALSWLVGTGVAAVAFVLDNLELADLTDAIDRSNEGKVKLEFFRVYSSVSYPTYIELQNFEPWNNDLIEFPENYSHSFTPGVYDTSA